MRGRLSRNALLARFPRRHPLADVVDRAALDEELEAARAHERVDGGAVRELVVALAPLEVLAVEVVRGLEAEQRPRGRGGTSVSIGDVNPDAAAHFFRVLLEHRREDVRAEHHAVELQFVEAIGERERIEPRRAEGIERDTSCRGPR